MPSNWKSFFTGIFIGFLLKRYSYRKVALFGSILNSTGLILTSQASSLTHIILTYSIVGGKTQNKSKIFRKNGKIGK